MMLMHSHTCNKMWPSGADQRQALAISRATLFSLWM